MSRMAIASRLKPPCREDRLPIIATDTPIMYEDEGQEEMGESEPHTITQDILYHGVKAHLAIYPKYQRYHVFSNLNLLYSEIDRRAYVSPDMMVVAPLRKLRPNVRSYRVGTTGPAPVLTAEVLSERSYQQQDFYNKPKIYADLQVPEYILVDVTGEFMQERLLLKRHRGGRRWKDERDLDGGITSRLGFRLVIEHDDKLRVIDAQTGYRYVRPDEAQVEAQARLAEAQARRQAEERVKELETELDRLQAMIRERKKNDR